jgi:hypothetical protein
MATADFIERAYIAFFNRPADRYGFDWWRESALPDQALLDEFAASPEYLSDYAGKSNKAIIQTIYSNLFGRQPEQAGLDFWTKEMDQGWVTVSNAAYAILGGAQGTDLSTINNKVKAAQAFTDTVNAEPDVAYAYAYDLAGQNGMGHVANNWLAKVSHDSASLSTAQASLNGIWTTLKNAIPDPHVYIAGGLDPTFNQFEPFNVASFHDTVKWTGTYAGAIDWRGFNAKEDHLDFTALGASAVFASTLVNNVATSQRWLGDTHFSAGSKYISLTRPSTADSMYKIELWTLQGNVPDAYGGGQGFSVGTGPEKPDTAQLIGFIDLGMDLNAGTPIHVELASIR